MRRSSAVVLVAVALLSVAGCGGSLSAPDGGGGSGGTGSGGTTGSGGITGIDSAISIGDVRDVGTCPPPDQPATPVVDVACRYTIPLPPCDYADRTHVGVRVDGVEIPRDTTHTNGWDYTDATFTEVDIFGSRCDALTSGTATSVTIVYKIILP